MHNTGNVDLARKISLRVFGEERRGRHHGADRALHIRCAPAVDPPVVDLSAVGLVGPFGLIGNGHGVNVPIEQQHLSRPIALDAPQNVSVLIHNHFVEAKLVKRLLHALNDGILLSGIALPLNKRLA